MTTTEPKKPKITWDEEVIAEHDKLRGTRMKIDEPDTPFAYLEDDGAELADDDDDVAAAAAAGPAHGAAPPALHVRRGGQGRRRVLERLRHGVEEAVRGGELHWGRLRGAGAGAGAS